MDEVREIVTKAVVGKGKKVIKINEVINPNIDITNILGCWVINHKYQASITGQNEVVIVGNAEVDLWVSTNNNTQTDVVRQNFNYTQTIKTRSLVRDLCNSNLDVLVTICDGPTSENVTINDDNLNVTIVIEIVVEVIGETKVQVIICEPIELLDDNFDNEINEDFLKEE